MLPDSFQQQSLQALVALLVLILTHSCWSFITAKRQLPLPPGPPKLPLIGNLHQAPTSYPWRQFAQWTREYGPIFSLQYGLQTLIVLGTTKTATDLLDKRGAIYSNRPRMVMGHECVSKGLRMVLMQYDKQFRLHQRVEATYLNPSMAPRYRSIQDLESRQAMCTLMADDGSNFFDEFARYTSSIMYTLCFGIRLATGHEPEVKAVEEVGQRFMLAARPGTWIVDALPVLNHMPNFLAPWKRLADEWHKDEAKLFTDNMKRGLASQSWNWCKHVSQLPEAKRMSEEEIAYDFGTMFEAGTDTTTIALRTFVLAAVVQPDLQQKAHEELDRICGSERLPAVEDIDKLLYVQAIIKEAMRWRPITAGGIPHAVERDDEYMGYRIPKDAVVIGNNWGIHHDEELYPEPEKIRPERWIENPQLPFTMWGFGRRICTGQWIASNSVAILVARMLWAFDIEYALEKGQIDTFAFTQGFNSGPQPFKASFKLRDDGRRKAIEKAWQEAEKDVGILLDRAAPTRG